MERNSEIGSASWAEEPRVDTRRYVDVLKRRRALIVLITVVLTLVVLAVSLLLPKEYTASATIVLNTESGLFGPPDAASTERQLSTIGELITTPQTKAEAADRVPGATPDSIGSAITTNVDQEANLIDVIATDADPDQAARIANATANSFLTVQRDLQRERLLGAKATLEAQIEQLSGGPGAEEEIAAIRSRISRLGVQAASAGTDLQLVEAATPPSSPSSPKPLRNTLFAFFAAVFIGVLVALGRDQLSPELTDSKTVSALLGAPVLAGIPYVGKRFGRNRAVAPAVEHEAYQTLSASIQAILPPADAPRAILVTSAVHAEGKSTATSRLGRALAQAGHRTLLISGDLRWPELHALFSAPQAPGLSDLLEEFARGRGGVDLLRSVVQPVSLPTVNGRPSAGLDLIASGSPPDSPSGLLASGGTDRLASALKSSGYEYVLVDGPPSLGIADVQPLSKLADYLLVITRLNRVKVADLVDFREILGRLEVDLFGVAVIGTQVDPSPYYLTERRALFGSHPINEQPSSPLTYRDQS